MTQTAFSILESMLGLLMASMLVSVLLMAWVSFKTGYQRVMVLSVLQDDGRYAVMLLRAHIHAAQQIIQVIPQSQITRDLQKKLNSDSDVLLLKEQDREIAYYLATASWKQGNEPVESLFKKSLTGNRQELVSHVVGLHFKKELGGISYEITVRSTQPILRFVKKSKNRFLYRTWSGFAAKT